MELKAFGKRIVIVKNKTTQRWKFDTLPFKQRLMWAGPIFILIQPLDI